VANLGLVILAVVAVSGFSPDAPVLCVTAAALIVAGLMTRLKNLGAVP